MKSSEVLREAARTIELGRGTFGCLAIADVMGLYAPWKNGVADIPRQVMAAYRKVAPRGHNLSDPWWDTDERGECSRIIGLCLAAAIAEDEGD